jgi:hypothetical protein
MQPSSADRLRRAARWLAAGAWVGLAPKCGLCVMAYLGAGAALGLKVPEFCGPPDHPAHGWSLGFLALATALGVVGFGRPAIRLLRRRRFT